MPAPAASGRTCSTGSTSSRCDCRRSASAEDIPLLAAHFLEKHARAFRREVSEFEPEALRVLSGYAWPGNVHELENAVDQVRERFSREYLLALMREFKGNVTRAAERARVERETLHRLLDKHGIRGHSFRDEE